MKNYALMLVPVALLVAGCSGDGSLLARGDVSIEGCEPPPSVGPCNGNPADPKVIVNFTGMTAAPPNVCAHAGTTVRIEIVPAPTGTGTVATMPKTSNQTWLVNSNDPDPSVIFVKVPPTLPPGGDYDYSVVNSDGKCLDPRIHIN